MYLETLAWASPTIKKSTEAPTKYQNCIWGNLDIVALQAIQQSALVPSSPIVAVNTKHVHCRSLTTSNSSSRQMISPHSISTLLRMIKGGINGKFQRQLVINIVSIASQHYLINVVMSPLSSPSSLQHCHRTTVTFSIFAIPSLRQLSLSTLPSRHHYHHQHAIVNISSSSRQRLHHQYRLIIICFNIVITRIVLPISALPNHLWHECIVTLPSRQPHHDNYSKPNHCQRAIIHNATVIPLQHRHVAATLLSSTYQNDCQHRHIQRHYQH